jgi:hypothetical protein
MVIDWEAVINWETLDKMNDDEIVLLHNILTKEDNNG